MFSLRGQSKRFTFTHVVEVALCLLTIMFFGINPSAHATSALSQPQTSEEKLLVIGFSGVTWNEVTKEHTPNLYAFGHAYAPANIVTRSVRGTTCPIEGWLTINAGQRALDPRKGCLLPKINDHTTVPQWTRLAEENSRNSYGAPLGLLGEILQKENISSLTIGAGAALAIADSNGHINGTYIETAPLHGSLREQPANSQERNAPSASSTEEGAQDDATSSATQKEETPKLPTAAEAYASTDISAALTIVDLGAIRYPNSQLTHNEAHEATTTNAWKQIQASFGKPSTTPDEIYAQLAELDRQFGEIINKTPKDTRIIVLSVGDNQTDAAQLGYFASSIPFSPTPSLTSTNGADTTHTADSPVVAYSEATRQEGLIQLTDIFPTLLKELGSPSLSEIPTVGSPVHYVSWKGDAVTKIVGDYQRASLVRPLVGPFYLANIILFCLVVLLFFSRHRLKNPQFFVQIATWTASIPVASLLVNLLSWWKTSNPTGTLIAGITMIAAIIAGLALFVRRRYRYGHIAVVAGVTTVTLTLDVLLDSLLPGYPLQLGSFMGAQPQVGGRFYGFSNGTFTLFATGVFLLMVVAGNWMRQRHNTDILTTEKSGGAPSTAEKKQGASLSSAHVRRWSAPVVILCIGALAVFIDGSAAFGADFGGPPVIVVGTCVLVMVYSGVRVTVPRVCGVVCAALAVSFIFAYVDFLRDPVRRSHLGRFVQSVVEGNPWGVVTRKISQVGLGLPWPVVLLLGCSVLGVLAWAWYRWGIRGRAYSWLGDVSCMPPGRACVLALGLALTVGMLINDSGVVLPAVGTMLALPLWCVEMFMESCVELMPEKGQASSETTSISPEGSR